MHFRWEYISFGISDMVWQGLLDSGLQKTGASFYQIAVGGFEVARVPRIGYIAVEQSADLGLGQSSVCIHNLIAKDTAEIADIIILHA